MPIDEKQVKEVVDLTRPIRKKMRADMQAIVNGAIDALSDLNLEDEVVMMCVAIEFATMTGTLRQHMVGMPKIKTDAMNKQIVQIVMEDK